MKIRQTKIFEIDLEKEHKRIDETDYSSAQKEKLHKLVNMFEQGDFVGCRKFIVNEIWSYDEKLGCCETEFISNKIWSILYEFEGDGVLEIVKE